MSPYHQPAAGKRKLDCEDPISRKRNALETSVSEASQEHYWMVQWRNPQSKKHKTWDGDAVLTCGGSRATLRDVDGKILGVGSLDKAPSEGINYTIGGKELELERAIPRDEYMSGACFGGVSVTGPTPCTKTVKQFIPLKPSVVPKVPSRLSSKKGIPLQPVDLISVADNLPFQLTSGAATVESSYWTATWRNSQQKKLKTWDGDAFVSHSGKNLVMISEEGKILGSTTWKGDTLFSGYQTFINGKEVQLDIQVNASELPIIAPTSHEPSRDSSTSQSDSFATSIPPKSQSLNATRIVQPPLNKFVPPKSFYGVPKKPKPQGPLHNPDVDGAVVMKAPGKEHLKKFNEKNLPVAPVVLDPILARQMRPHQKEGFKFLYECVMGLRKHEGQGCILADEMGLGKTLQTIALVWTLLKQNPYVGVGPVVGKVLIVCPVSLVNNWRSEFHKWLGKDRVGVFTGDKDKSIIKQFLHSKIHQVLVIGYERLRTVIDELSYCHPPIGLIICDEGHRLKSAQNKTSMMFKSLRTPRRIILSGTPIQNDLGEFYAMADFCNPGLLDDYISFRRVFETPILKSRTPDCTTKEAELGEARCAQLLEISKSFVLRRDATILKTYLPPKYEYVVFITPTALQLSMFKRILNPEKMDDLMQSSTAESLALINVLTKISNSPILLKAVVDKAKAKEGQNGDTMRQRGILEAVKLIPDRTQVGDPSLSGKLIALSNLLKALHQNTDEKCIVVSHYTSTLNVLEAFCKLKSYSFHRLDGQTPAGKRQEYVNSFNKASQHKCFLFLLSSKAGGVGLNLIGASRLCLIDSDWNPSHDLQAMARIHRDGQKRPVFIYRFLTAGAIDEKIYQRQVTKLGLTNTLIGSGTSGSKLDSFSRKDLHDIFKVHPDTVCNTHELLDCPCISEQGSSLSCDNPSDEEESCQSDEDEEIEKGFVAASQVKPKQIQKADKSYIRKKKEELAALGEWTHIHCLRSDARDNVRDHILRKLLHFDREEATDGPTPQSRLETLLAATDLENITASDAKMLRVANVPGGTISFLFEKSSQVIAEESEE